MGTPLDNKQRKSGAPTFTEIHKSTRKLTETSRKLQKLSETIRKLQKVAESCRNYFIAPNRNANYQKPTMRIQIAVPLHPQLANWLLKKDNYFF